MLYKVEKVFKTMPTMEPESFKMAPFESLKMFSISVIRCSKHTIQRKQPTYTKICIDHRESLAEQYPLVSSPVYWGAVRGFVDIIQ